MVARVILPLVFWLAAAPLWGQIVVPAETPPYTPIVASLSNPIPEGAQVQIDGKVYKQNGINDDGYVHLKGEEDLLLEPYENVKIEGLKGELARMRGSHEQLARDVAEVQKRQRDLAQASDDRIARLEPVKVTLDGQDFMASPEEKRSYDEALGVMRTGDFDKALAAFAAFQRRYPGSGYAEAVRFWTANALYGKRDYKEAVAAFRAFVNAAPKHPRAPEALLALANSQAEMKDRPGARKTLDELIKTYPQSEAAQAGKERLATLK
jgi:tol-pal system protein YbgF